MLMKLTHCYEKFIVENTHCQVHVPNTTWSQLSRQRSLKSLRNIKGKIYPGDKKAAIYKANQSKTLDNYSAHNFHTKVATV